LHGDLQARALDLAVAVVELTDGFPGNTKGWEIGRQLIRAGTSIGANLCEADHALTDADFAHKASIARKEAAETAYWLKVCVRARIASGDSVAGLAAEVDEFVRILSAMVRKTQSYISRSGARR